MKAVFGQGAAVRLHVAIAPQPFVRRHQLNGRTSLRKRFVHLQRTVIGGANADDIGSHAAFLHVGIKLPGIFPNLSGNSVLACVKADQNAKGVFTGQLTQRGKGPHGRKARRGQRRLLHLRFCFLAREGKVHRQHPLVMKIHVRPAG